MRPKVVVLLSSGLDSTVNLFECYSKDDIQLVLTFDYGQRAAQKEIHNAAQICKSLGLSHQVVDVSFMKKFGNSALIDHRLKIPMGSAVQINHFQTSTQTAKSVWVPNRNGIFLNIAAGYAESLGADFVVPGFNKEEAITFPDNSEDFMKKLDASFFYSTANHVKVKCYTVSLEKAEIVRRAIELKVPFDLLWPCYFDDEKWCGECESCQRSLRAFQVNRVDVRNLCR